MTIQQIRTGRDNFSYLIYCENTRNAALVDPGPDASQCLNIIKQQKLNLEYIINTHHHTDHTGGNAGVKAALPSRIVASSADASRISGGVDMIVNDGEEILLGEITLKFILTPGHTPGGICILVDNVAIITGDTLFIGDCGRTDLPCGSDSQMFDTIQWLNTLPDQLIVYPGHDYGPQPFDTLGNQKQTNKVMLAKTLEDFKLIP